MKKLSLLAKLGTLRTKAMPIIIDGYNLLRAVQNSYEQGGKLSEAVLCRIISEYLKRIRDHGHIVFDGIGPPDKSGLADLFNLRISFVGADTDADTVIEATIVDNSAPKRLIVVSTDRRLRAAAGKRKAISVRSDIFWQDLIRRLDKKIPTPEPQEKRHGISDVETDQWLDVFGIEEE